MQNKDFNISQAEWEQMKAHVHKQDQHQHTGVGDSLQIDPAKALSGQQFYGLFSKVTLTAAQVKALHSAPQTLVPAAGANSVVVVDSVDAKLVFNSTAYTGSNNLQFLYTNGSGTKVTADMGSAFLDSSSTAYDHVAGVVTELAPTVNAPVVVAVPTANPAAGDSVLTIITKYRILTF